MRTTNRDGVGMDGVAVTGLIVVHATMQHIRLHKMTYGA